MTQETPKNLSQVIVVNASFENKTLLAQYIAKAPVLLITRCFKSVKDFIGNYESTEFEKDILHWVNECNQQMRIVQVQNPDDLEAFSWTGEMMGAPVKLIKHEEELAVLVLGPYDASTLNDIVESADEYK